MQLQQPPSHHQPDDELNAPRFEIRLRPAADHEQVLRAPDTLAVFGFGLTPRAHADPRWVQIPLDENGAPQIEVWRSPRPVTHGRTGPIAWAQDGEVLFGVLEPEEDRDDLARTTTQAYSAMSGFMAERGFPHLLRTWNYLDAVTQGEGDDERYRRFCVGRAEGSRLREHELPAATCVGRHDGQRRLQLAWMSARTPGRPLENPRQTSAYRYPRQYGPQAPSFSRALLPADTSGLPLLLSGTAAIIGHRSQHPGSLEQQFRETVVNLQHLIQTAQPHVRRLPDALGQDSVLRVYVRNRQDIARVEALLERELGGIARVILHAEVCRPDLLVEIEGIHA